MDKYDKGNLAIFWGSYCAGATLSIPLLFTGSAPWVLTVVKFIGILGSGAATAFVSVIFKYYGDQVVLRIKRKRRIKLRNYARQKQKEKAERAA